jgi:hypothetical protein
VNLRLRRISIKHFVPEDCRDFAVGVQGRPILDW